MCFKLEFVLAKKIYLVLSITLCAKLERWKRFSVRLFFRCDNNKSYFLQLFINLFSQDAEAEDLKAQKKEMEDIVQPIIAKLYQVGYIASF